MKLILLLSFILALSLVSSYYPGETYTFTNPLGTEKLSWTIIDNSTPLTILPQVTYNLTNITVHFPSDMPPNVFTLVFLEEQTNEVITEVRVGGGGGKTKYINKTEYVNQTQYVEVPTYIDREVEKIVYVNQTEENNTILNKYPLDKLSQRTWIVILSILLIVILICVYIIIKAVKVKDELNIYGDTE